MRPAACHRTFPAQPAPLSGRVITRGPVARVDRMLAAWKVLKRCRPQGLLAGKLEALPPARAPRGLTGAIAPALRSACRRRASGQSPRPVSDPPMAGACLRCDCMTGPCRTLVPARSGAGSGPEPRHWQGQSPLPFRYALIRPAGRGATAPAPPLAGHWPFGAAGMTGPYGTVAPDRAERRGAVPDPPGTAAHVRRIRKTPRPASGHDAGSAGGQPLTTGAARKSDESREDGHTPGQLPCRRHAPATHKPHPVCRAPGRGRVPVACRGLTPRRDRLRAGGNRTSPWPLRHFGAGVTAGRICAAFAALRTISAM